MKLNIGEITRSQINRISRTVSEHFEDFDYAAVIGAVNNNVAVLAWDGDDIFEATPFFGFVISVKIQNKRGFRFEVFVPAVDSNLPFEHILMVRPSDCPTVVAKSKNGYIIGNVISYDGDSSIVLEYYRDGFKSITVNKDYICPISDITFPVNGVRREGVDDANV